MNVYALGASKNIGYFAALRLLTGGATVTFLLRSTSGLQEDAAIKPYIQSGKAHLVKGDGLNPDDVRKGWEESLNAGQGTIDLVLFSVGGLPNFSITKGFTLDPPDLVTRCFFNLLSSMPSSIREPSTQPKIVAVTSGGLTRDGHKKVPILLKPLYGVLLSGPHDDKLGAETIAAHYVGRDFKDKDIKEEILPSNWAERDGVMERGSFKKLVIIRPSLLTDGDCKADQVKEGGKPAYRLADQELSGYTVSRKDVAHFIAGDLIKDWSQWEGKCVSISY